MAKRRGDPKRGRHKRRRSPETVVWERDHMQPERPAWLEQPIYQRLLELRDDRGGARSDAL